MLEPLIDRFGPESTMLIWAGEEAPDMLSGVEVVARRRIGDTRGRWILQLRKEGAGS
jgi:hypothetical protein